MRVTFVVNELRPRDDALADRVESEVREAAADVASEEAVLRCRVQPHGTPLAGFAVHLEGPHWYGSFEVKRCARLPTMSTPNMTNRSATRTTTPTRNRRPTGASSGISFLR